MYRNMSVSTTGKRNIPHSLIAWMLVMCGLSTLTVGCGGVGAVPAAKNPNTSNTLTLTPDEPMVRVGDETRMHASQDQAAVAGGTWSVTGGASNGSIDANGVYHAPPLLPDPSVVTISYTLGSASANTQLQIGNPVPAVVSTDPSLLSQDTTPVMIAGTGFLPSSQVLVNDRPAPTTYIDLCHLRVLLSISPGSTAPVRISVANPAPGVAISAPVVLGTSFPIMLMASSTTVRAGASVSVSAVRDGILLSGGVWSVRGDSSQGVIDSAGHYTAPALVPAGSLVSINFTLGSESQLIQLAISPPGPVITALDPATVSQSVTQVTLFGTAFAVGSQVAVNGVDVPTTYVDGAHLRALVTLPRGGGSSVQVVVSNPGQEPAVSRPFALYTKYPLTVSSDSDAIHAGATMQFRADRGGVPAENGSWSVLGGLAYGSIDASGLYTAPANLPLPNQVTVQYAVNTEKAIAQVDIENPVPRISSAQPAVISQLSTPITLSGAGFVNGSQVVVNGTPVRTTYVDGNHVQTVIVLQQAKSTPISVVVANPAPGAIASKPVILATNFIQLAVEPAMLSPGNVTLTLSGSSFSNTTTVSLDGKSLQTTYVSPTSLRATGYLPPWKNDSVTISVRDSAAPAVQADVQVPLAPVEVSFDTAARFSTQAAFGPNPAVVARIQREGLKGFITEQLNQPTIEYPLDGLAPRSRFLQAAVQSDSLLRLRVAWALRSYIDVPNSEFYPAVSTWEHKLELAATGNYRDLLTVIASDPMIGTSLTLAGNVAPSDPNLHPNQNFAREIMQLFSLGTTQLNDDGTPRLDAYGQPLPTYDQNTILELSRVFTGWELPTPVNPQFTQWGVDYSQTLVPVEREHDRGAKVLFGTVTIPAGGTTMQDRELALDAILLIPICHHSCPAS